MRTKVVMRYGENKPWTEGETGYIDGYISGSNGVPLAIVVLGDRVLMCTFNFVRAIGLMDVAEYSRTLDL